MTSVACLSDQPFSTHDLRLRGSLWVHKYEFADENWQLTYGGEPDISGTCALPTASGCDYAMKHSYVMEYQVDTSLLSFSLPYFGNTDQGIANATIILDAHGNTPSYDPDTHGEKAWVDPLSGDANAMPTKHIATHSTLYRAPRLRLF